MRKVHALLCGLIAAVLVLFPLCLSAKADVNSQVMLADYDDCLTEAEEARLLEEMGAVSSKTGLNIGIVITADLNGKTSKKYAESFCDSSFGKKADSIVLLLFNSHDLPQYENYDLYCDYIFMNENGGYGLLYDSINKLFDRIYEALDKPNIKSDLPSKANVYKNYSSANYYMGCLNFCSAVERYGDPAVAARNKTVEFFITHIPAIFAGIVIGVITAVIFSLSIKKSYTKKSPISAAQYLDKSRIEITRREDSFIREYTSSYRTSSSSSSGGRSGGSHHSSGGHRGGGGGRHR